MEILRKLNDSNIDSDLFLINLNELDTFIKENESFRSHTVEEFYTVITSKLEHLLGIENKNWFLLRHVLKCVKNSAAAFKTQFYEQENNLCKLLLRLLVETGDTLSRTLPIEDKFQFYLSIFQYFFNLIQGNQKACDIFLQKWIDLSLNFILKPNIAYEIYEITSMIIIYSCKQKFKNEIMLQNMANQLTWESYTKLIESLEEKFQDRTEKYSTWTYKFIDNYFDYMYLNHLAENRNVNTLSHRTRFFILTHINDRLLDSKETKIQQCYLAPKSLELLCHFYTVSIEDLLTHFDGLLNDLVHRVVDSLKEVKLLANILSDILTMEETRMFGNRYMVAFVQDQIGLFKSTCRLFKEIHVNKEYLNLMSKYPDYSEWFNLKCELVRLIGILVYENEQNQNYLVNDDLLHIISSNLSLDIDNPFVREWSIVALKHILANLDKK